MLAISPQFCPSGWLLDEPILPHQENLNYFSREATETSKSIDLSPNSSRTLDHKNSEFTSTFHDGFDGDKMAKTKKLNHNASERDRRKKINTLYADLRSLLPQQDQSVSCHF